MGAELRRLARKRANGWQRVTNELVISFARKDCIDCKGAGVLVGKDDRRRPCPCCDAPFKEAHTGRLRRMDNGRLEFRPLAASVDIEDAGPAEEE